jgi:hypothetical protein
MTLAAVRFRLVSVFIILAAASVCACAQSARETKEVKDALAFSCHGKPFVRVAALTQKRDSFPSVELTITDPVGRVEGEENRSKRIPDSSYGRIVEVPQHPEMSKAVAVEVCNAEQGIYSLEIGETGSGPYVVMADGDGDVDIGGSTFLYHVGRPGRVLRYKFRFTIKDRKVDIGWLDDKGKEQAILETPEW